LTNFSGASENENFCDFPLRRYRWKDLMREKQLFMGSPVNKVTTQKLDRGSLLLSDVQNVVFVGGI